MKYGPGPARSLADLQALVDAWIRERGRYWAPLSQYARLAEELGELGRELNHRFGEKPRAAKDGRGSVAEELGDILFVVMALANSLDIDLDGTFRQTLQKYEARQTDTVSRVTAAAGREGPVRPAR